MVEVQNVYGSLVKLCILFSGFRARPHRGLKSNDVK